MFVVSSRACISVAFTRCQILLHANHFGSPLITLAVVCGANIQYNCVILVQPTCGKGFIYNILFWMRSIHTSNLINMFVLIFICAIVDVNKTRIQWTLDSQIYHSNQETIFGQKLFLNKQDKYTMDPGQSSLSQEKVTKNARKNLRLLPSIAYC